MNEEKMWETAKNFLNEEDFLAMKRNYEITKTYFVPGGAVASVGNTMKPWKNNVTLYKDCPFLDNIRSKVMEMDPEVTFAYRDGWKEQNDHKLEKILIL